MSRSYERGRPPPTFWRWPPAGRYPVPVTLRLYDTATRGVHDFVPVIPGKVGIYHCGLTVQGPPHVGHIRKEVTFDVARRWFEHLGYDVTLVANITDIDDKILAKEHELGPPVVGDRLRQRAGAA